MTSACRLCLLVCCGVTLLAVLCLWAQDPPRTGPETEKRFPPLQLPPGFQATLFACDPLIEYPSAIALGPRPGSIFVAVDYLTGLGTEIVRRDEIRLIEDTDGDGYADKATVYAEQFNSIQGLTFHDGTIYAMHAPHLTALRDTNADGKADERRDLLSGLGLPPEKNPVRLHCANGLVMGHDGWLYLALGDHGCDVPRPEGDRLILEGGGVLRCRRDGRDLHVFATGLRNIYDVALDEELNVFVRDNENDGGDYKIRLCHSFFGADHGYPYLYYERPNEALPPLADLGLGSSAGGLCYLERQFPAEYRGNLFFCEWGRSVVRYRPERAGSAFASPLKEHVFAAGAPTDPYGFKPTDLVVERDGSLIVADWADGQQPKRGRGRIYRIRYVGEPSASSSPSPLRRGGQGGEVARLDSESYYERVQAQEAIARPGAEGIPALLEALTKKQLGVHGRLHAIWVLSRAGGPLSQEKLFELAKADPDPRVQARAVRALADLTDPVLARHRLDAGPGDAETAVRVAALADGKDPRVLLEVVIALGRLHWRDAPGWLNKTLTKPDAALAHAAMQTLRRSNNWPAVLKLIDLPSTEPIRAIALRAVADQTAPELVDGLIDRVDRERDPARRSEYADALTRVYKRRGPWVYWGYRPPPRPPNSIAWERTDPIAEALHRTLADPGPAVRLVVLRRMQRENIPTQLTALGDWLREEKEPERLGPVLEALREHPAQATRDLLESAAASSAKPASGRLTALALFAAGLDEAGEDRLLALANRLEDGPVLAEAVRQLGKRPRLKSGALLRNKLGSPEAAVRAAVLEALAELAPANAEVPPENVFLGLLEDRDVLVRRAAAFAAGKLGVRAAREPLLKLARDTDAAVRRAGLESLCLLKEPRAVPIAATALADPETSVAALRLLAELGGADQADRVAELARHNPSAEILPLAMRALSRWGGQKDAVGRIGNPSYPERLAAELQGTSGQLARWHVAGPLPEGTAKRLAERFAALPKTADALPEREALWQTVFGAGVEARVSLKQPGPNAAWIAHTDLHVSESMPVQFLMGGNLPLRVWLNGSRVHQRDQPRAFQADGERFEATLQKGANRVCVQLTAAGEAAPVFHLRFRRKSTKAEHEKLMQAALNRSGNVERGRKVFLDAQKSQCIKCHRIATSPPTPLPQGGRVENEGERIGPDLTGIGNRLARVQLIESILEPSRTVTAGYQTVVVSLKDGRVLSGVKISEVDGTLTLADQQGQVHRLARPEVEDQRPSPLSTMPDGLEKQLTTDEFVDLIAFLVAQNETRSK